MFYVVKSSKVWRLFFMVVWNIRVSSCNIWISFEKNEGRYFYNELPSLYRPVFYNFYSFCLGYTDLCLSSVCHLAKG